MAVAPSSVVGAEKVLTPDALEFVLHMDRLFHDRRDVLLGARRTRRARLAAGESLDFLPETAGIRSSEWQVAQAPADLLDRRVEITGPTDPKMAINALNSGARVWLADLEDSNTPHWKNVVEGQVVLQGVARKNLSFTSPEGKQYALKDGALATLVVRPRGWHFDEKHLTESGRPVVGAIFDFGMHFFHNAKELIARGSGPYFYLPKMESHLEARLWNDIFVEAQRFLGIPQGSIRATVLIETIPAAFEMEEILYELKDHASGLNAGRWDYMFSIVKNFRDAGAKFVLPDRASLTMTAPMMRAYTDLLVSTCHRRGAFAMGGMAAFIPSRKDEEINKIAIEKVTADKKREVTDGFDGSWVAHPDLVSLCADIFTSVLGDRPNQLDRLRPEVNVTAAQLLSVDQTPGSVSEGGLHQNIDIALQYLAAWLDGNGAASIHNLMEDAATAEISRSQIWQQVRNSVTYSDTGRVATKALVQEALNAEVLRLKEAGFDPQKLAQAAQLFERVSLADEYVDFLTLPALEMID
ncbi:MAG: malate synthase A [Actinobacteria bacterium]|nr:malate synthase A [Actinomycetota bacterium]